jgi:hemophore-related protein
MCRDGRLLSGPGSLGTRRNRWVDVVAVVGGALTGEGVHNMVKLSLGKLAAAVGGVAVAWSAATGIASADPIVDTTCNYGQVMAALNATDPATAAQLNQSPMAQSYLRNFLAAPPPKRAQMAQQIRAMPQAAQFMGTIEQVAGVCNNY